MENLRKRSASELESNNQVISSSDQSMPNMVEVGPTSVTGNVIHVAPPLALVRPENTSIVQRLKPVSLINGGQNAMEIPTQSIKGFNMSRLPLPTQSASDTVCAKMNINEFSRTMTKQNSRDEHQVTNLGDVREAIRKRKKLKFTKKVDSSKINPGKTNTMNKVTLLCPIIDKINQLDIPNQKGTTTVKTTGTCEENLRNTVSNSSGIATPVAIYPNKVNEMNMLNLNTNTLPSNSCNTQSENTAHNLNEHRMIIDTEDVSSTEPATVVKDEPDKQVKVEPGIHVNCEPDTQVNNEQNRQVINELDIQVKVEPDIQMNYEPDIQVNNEPDRQVYYEPDRQVYSEPDRQVYSEPDRQVYNEPDTTSSMYAMFPGQSYPFYTEPVQQPDSAGQAPNSRATTVITTNGKQRHHPDCKRGQSERRERKKQLARKRYKEKIFIGPHIEKWNRVKEELNFSLNYELAGYLLKQYETWKKISQQQPPSQTSSHPYTTRPEPNTRPEPDTSSTDTGEEESMDTVEDDEQFEKQQETFQYLPPSPVLSHHYMTKPESDTSSTLTGEEDEEYDEWEKSSQYLPSSDSGDEDEQYEKWKESSQQPSSASMSNHPYMTRHSLKKISQHLPSAQSSSVPNTTQPESHTSSTEDEDKQYAEWKKTYQHRPSSPVLSHPYTTKPEPDTSSTDTGDEESIDTVEEDEYKG
uniref:Uncharacterized protein n=1 Tax=Magallana gigas TaxID=29159 RepID=A0A8W8JM04_MAGGI